MEAERPCLMVVVCKLLLASVNGVNKRRLPCDIVVGWMVVRNRFKVKYIAQSYVLGSPLLFFVQFPLSLAGCRLVVYLCLSAVASSGDCKLRSSNTLDVTLWEKRKIQQPIRKRYPMLTRSLKAPTCGRSWIKLSIFWKIIKILP